MALQSAAAYVTSKTAVVGLTRSIAVDAAPYGFRCNAVCPGFIDTDMTRAVLAKDPARRQRIEARIPSHAFGLPEDIAHAVFFLLSDDARYVNGVALPVDRRLLDRLSRFPMTYTATVLSSARSIEIIERERTKEDSGWVRAPAVGHGEHLRNRPALLPPLSERGLRSATAGDFSATKPAPM